MTFPRRPAEPYPCGRCRHPLTRRELLTGSAGGFAAVALAALRPQWTAADSGVSPGKDAIAHHHPPRAKNIIFLYMDGGPSQIDTFDPKPLLERHHGANPTGLFDVAPTQFDNNGSILASPWKFKPYGQSGIPVSDLLPRVAEHVDEMTIVRSMVAESPEHTSANYFLHTGSPLQGRPSMGAWVNYALGSENENLPGFVVVNGGLVPPGGLDCFGSGFLPADHQGSIFKPSGTGLANIRPPDGLPVEGRAMLDLIADLDEASAERWGTHPAIESAVRNYELAAGMQLAVPDLMDLGGETAETRALYGLDAEFEPTRIFAAECLLARRLVERGVRFIELTCPSVGHDRWDQHSKLKAGHEANARAVDQPIAALLTDLKRIGLLEETLVVWAGEFGRTPFAQGTDGRDHNPFGFSIWLAGGGVRGGQVYGATDEWGYKAVEGRTEIHDLHATMLHLLGVDHLQSTFRFGGRDMRLTDVKGHVVEAWLA